MVLTIVQLYEKRYCTEQNMWAPVLYLQGSCSCSYAFNGDTGDNFNVN